MRFAFQLCRDLGIDDPTAWFNAVPPKVVDGWVAFYTVDAEMKTERNKMQNPSDALATLTAQVSNG